MASSTAVDCVFQSSVAVSLLLQWLAGESPCAGMHLQRRGWGLGRGSHSPPRRKGGSSGQLFKGLLCIQSEWGAGGQGGFAWAAQIWKDLCENFRATTR